MRPQKKDLVSYNGNIEDISREFSVSSRTATRWLKYYGLYCPKSNYGANKLNLNLARGIRKKNREGVPMKDLAKEYHVTFSTISRVIHNITYKEVTETAEVSVIYNIK